MRKLYVTKRYIANNLVMFGKYNIGFNLLNPIEDINVFKDFKINYEVPMMEELNRVDQLIIK
jgi:hypothetical protein